MGDASDPKRKRKGSKGKGFGTELKSIALVLVVILGVMWALELVDVLVGQPLNAYGLRPRRISGLIGIVTMPFLHGGIDHLAGNSVWLAVFGTMIMLRSRKEFALVFVSTTLLGGMGVWLFGNLFTANAIHIGASGVIFGCFGYILSMGFFERKVGSIIVSLGVLVLYGGFLYGVLPGQPGVSWEGHLFGFLAGLATARFVARRGRDRTPEAA